MGSIREATFAFGFEDSLIPGHPVLSWQRDLYWQASVQENAVSSTHNLWADSSIAPIAVLAGYNHDEGVTLHLVTWASTVKDFENKAQTLESDPDFSGNLAYRVELGECSSEVLS